MIKSWPHSNRWRHVSFTCRFSDSHHTFRTTPFKQTSGRTVRSSGSRTRRTRTAPPCSPTRGSHRVMCEYRGMRLVCAWCGQEGHFGATCNTPQCNRCGIFRHTTDGCTAPCKGHGHNHATRDCTQRRSYSAVAEAVDPREPMANVTAAGTPAPSGAGSDAPHARPFAHIKAAHLEASEALQANLGAHVDTVDDA